MNGPPWWMQEQNTGWLLKALGGFFGVLMPLWAAWRAGRAPTATVSAGTVTVSPEFGELMRDTAKALVGANGRLAKVEAGVDDLKNRIERIENEPLARIEQIGQDTNDYAHSISHGQNNVSAKIDAIPVAVQRTVVPELTEALPSAVRQAVVPPLEEALRQVPPPESPPGTEP